jgi:hypothetical protein
MSGQEETHEMPNSLWQDETWNKGEAMSADDDHWPLSWRQNPNDSLSDYTIVIHHESDMIPGAEAAEGASDTYHVHRVVLAVGCRKMQYFCRLFKSNMVFEELANSTSHIYLHPMAALAFPIMLDYVYWFPIKLDSFTATPLHFLSDYFDLRALRQDVFVFCQFDLGPQNCHWYYTQAYMLKDASMIRMIERLCVHQSVKVSRNRDMFRVSPTEFWVDVLEHKAASSCPGARANSSSLVEALLQAKSSEGIQGITPRQFEVLTDAKRLPRIETVSSALAILTWEKQCNRCHSRHRRSSSHDARSTLSDVVCVHHRCVSALARILVEETPVNLRGEYQSFVLSTIQAFDPALSHLLIAKLIEVMNAQVSNILGAPQGTPELCANRDSEAHSGTHLAASLGNDSVSTGCKTPTARTSSNQLNTLGTT